MQAIRVNTAMMAECYTRWGERETLLKLYGDRLIEGQDTHLGLAYWLDLQEVKDARKTLHEKAHSNCQ